MRSIENLVSQQNLPGSAAEPVSLLRVGKAIKVCAAMIWLDLNLATSIFVLIHADVHADGHVHVHYAVVHVERYNSVV